MNLVLFDPGEWRRPLDRTDVRAVHLLTILKLAPGDRFAAGEVGGPVGSLRLAAVSEASLAFDEDQWEGPPPPSSRVRLLIGTPRPPTARRLLKDLTTIGAAELHFVATDLGDKSYLQSTLWKGEHLEALREGAAQTRTTLLPTVILHPSLGKALYALAEAPGPKVVFDEGGVAWDRHPAHEAAPSGSPLWLALGPERGWSAAERQKFADRGWTIGGLGPRTLRTETACALALGVAVLKGWT